MKACYDSMTSEAEGAILQEILNTCAATILTAWSVQVIEQMNTGLLMETDTRENS